MTTATGNHVYSIPAGTHFLREFSAALLNGKIIGGFPVKGDTLSLSRAKIFVPTRRAARALADELARALAQHSGVQAAILPQILPLGSLAESETASLFETGAQSAGGLFLEMDTVPELERRMLLSELILGWGNAVRQAILSVGPDGQIETDENEDYLVTHAPGQAFHMAGELAGLIDEFIIEGIDPSALRTLVADEFDRYWSITLEFLKIALENWPKHLKCRNQIDRAQRYADLVDNEVSRFADQPPADPIIVVGSTGTNAATAKLIAAIARLPAGAVVLPGLDSGLDDASWDLLSGASGQKQDGAQSPSEEGIAGHPQAALAKLLSRLVISRSDVINLAAPKESVAARMVFLSQALRPPQTTDVWLDYRNSLSDEGVRHALANLAYVEAENEQQEALAISVAMRGVLETPDKTAVLITPDRRLARRVRSELRRWEIDVEESQGEPLDGTPEGLLAGLTLTIAPKPDAHAMIALLNHPGFRLGYGGDEIADLSRLMETGLLRGPSFEWADLHQAIAEARKAAADRHAHPAKQSISDDQWSAITTFAENLRDALQPLRELAGNSNFRSWFTTHQQVLDLLRQRPSEEQIIATPDRQLIERLFFEFSQLPDIDFPLDLAGYRSLFETIARDTMVPVQRQTHPRLKILGLLEARLIHADVKILGGLDETIWPPAAQTGAFLNRPMRAALNLSAPERRIGQTAHDFVEAMGADEVILTHLRKRDGAPAIESRFIQRLSALAGEPWKDCKQRGGELLKLARALDQPSDVKPVARPAPKPPLAIRPRYMSVTQVETWRRDPYSIYAQKILNLQPMEDAGSEPGPADTGTQLHDVIASYQETAKNDPHITASPDNAFKSIQAIALEVFEKRLQDAGFRTFLWPRIIASLNAFTNWDTERRNSANTIAAEVSGKLVLSLSDQSQFTLNARADRIEQLSNGSAAIIDYKSGRAPSPKEINAGFAPQMTLEAAMVARGAFDLFPAGSDVCEAIYVKLLGPDALKPTHVGGPKAKIPLADLCADHFDGLVALAEQYRNEHTPYAARPFPQFARRFSDYDHLARVKEWLADTSGDGE